MANTRVTTPVTDFDKLTSLPGLKLPSGDNNTSPTGANAEQGMIRNDTEETVDSSASAIAHYNGTNWQYFAATESPDSPPASPAPTQLDSTIPNFSYSANTAGRPNCRIVSSTTGYYSTKTSTGFTVGKFYCEMKFLSSSAYASGRCGPGVGNNSMNLNSYMGTDANSAGLLVRPEMFLYNGSYTGSPGSGSYSTNGIIMMAFDADTRKFFMGYNGTWSALTGDPITGAGNVLPADVSPFYWGGWGYNGSDSIEFNFYGSDMAYTIPQGYITA
jgi:hypothetical protein